MTAFGPFSARDSEQIAARGISRPEIERQLRLFRRPPEPIRLERPCRRGDGVERLETERHEELLALWSEAARSRRLVKFVPASGAASRMFASLRRALEAGAKADPGAIRALLEELPRFAFYEHLSGLLAGRGESLERLLAGGDERAILRALLEPEGLGLARLPKGLIEFHRYPEGARTAFQEHFVEGAGYVSDGGRPCRLHFTVASEWSRSFRSAFDAHREAWEELCGVGLELELSEQQRATDTLAVDLENRPFRRGDGRLLFRPAGHGSLIGNLERLDADLVFLKNIDNVAHQRLHGLSVTWKRLLAGHLLHLQRQAFALIERLEREPASEEPVEAAFRFLTGSFALRPAARVAAGGPASRRRWAADRLRRPLRVCGMVEVAGEPGGGPFWSHDAEGGVSGQIVEPPQVDRDSPDQRKIWESATHFNPVDLVCGLRDHRGRPFELSRFLDPDAAFVARKSHGGRPLKALERPGLWNGAMAGWNTAFVEVPAATFNPVKTLADLLRPAHQPGG